MTPFIFLGDYIDRGPDSKGVIDYIINLKEDDYNIRTLRGNHEDYLLRTFDNETVQKNILGISYRNKLKKEWFKFGGKETLESFHVSDVHEIPAKYITWMRALEYYIELDSFILVHAGMNFGIEDPYEDKHSMLWIKEFKVDPDKDRLQENNPWPCSGEPGFHRFIEVAQPVLILSTSITGFIWTIKKVSAILWHLELTSMEMKVQPNIDKP